MSFEKFFILSKTIFYLSLAFTAISTTLILNDQLTALRNDTRIELESYKTATTALVNTRADSLQTFVTKNVDTLNARVGPIERNTFKLANALRTDSKDVLGDFRKDTFKEIDSQATTFNSNVNTNLGVISGAFTKVSDSYSSIPNTFAKRFNAQTDCEHNALCWQNLTTDVMTNFRFTGRDLSNSAKIFTSGFPILMDNSQKVTTNFASITENVKKITTVHWYDRLLGIAVNGSLIYSRFNPASIPVTAVQFVTSQK